MGRISDVAYPGSPIRYRTIPRSRHKWLSDQGLSVPNGYRTMGVATCYRTKGGGRATVNVEDRGGIAA